jgi:hypothetical protein
MENDIDVVSHELDEMKAEEEKVEKVQNIHFILKLRDIFVIFIFRNIK